MKGPDRTKVTAILVRRNSRWYSLLEVCTRAGSEHSCLGDLRSRMDLIPEVVPETGRKVARLTDPNPAPGIPSVCSLQEAFRVEGRRFSFSFS
jgi:hypothetical protein